MFILSITLAFLFTIIGSSLIFFFKNINEDTLDIFTFISTGIMLSSTIFSLIIPCLNLNKINLLIPIFLFIGSFILFIIDKIFKKDIALLLSLSLHNIPEGLAITSLYTLNNKYKAFILTLGIIFQNIFDGITISFPLMKDKKKAFIYGVLSALIEPITAIISNIIILNNNYITSIFLSIASGSCLYVTINELVTYKKSLLTLLFILGFTLMMFIELLNI